MIILYYSINDDVIIACMKRVGKKYYSIFCTHQTTVLIVRVDDGRSYRECGKKLRLLFFPVYTEVLGKLHRVNKYQRVITGRATKGSIVANRRDIIYTCLLYIYEYMTIHIRVRHAIAMVYS